MAGKRNITLIQGDDYSHVITITDDSGAIDITGRTYTAFVRKATSQTVPDATFECVVTSAVDGEVTIYLAHGVTATLPVGCYTWSFHQNISGVFSTLLAGKLDVTAA